MKEQAIYKLGEVYAKLGCSPLLCTLSLSPLHTAVSPTAVFLRNREADSLRSLLTQIRPFFDAIAKAKTAKIGMYTFPYVCVCVCVCLRSVVVVV